MKKQSNNNIIVIEPSSGWRHINLAEIWRYRELLYFFTWRDLKIRYKQTVIGILWAVLQPFLTMVVFSVFFGRLAQIPSDGLPYPIFVYAGLLPWTLFAQGLSRSAESVVGHANLIQKVYFPRLIIPVAASLSALVDFFISLVILFVMMAYYHVQPTLHLFFWLPILMALNFLCCIGFGFWLAALNVMYRDVRYIVPFLIQLGLFVTPVIYPVSIVPEEWKWLVYLNPMAGIIEGFRAVLLGQGTWPIVGLTFSGIISFLTFISGVFFFRRLERKFADII